MRHVSDNRDLVRRFAEDFISGRDPRVASEIMSPGYTLHIGGHDLAGRDEVYLPAVGAQFAQFPDLTLTVHDLVVTEDAAAIAFTEYGTSRRRGRAAAWRGVALFAVRDGRLVEGWAEEDYLARRRQLDGEPAHPVDAPATSPWTGAVRPFDSDAAAVVRTWLGSGAASCPGLACDDVPTGGEVAAILEDEVGAPCVDAVVAGAGKVAFHATWQTTHGTPSVGVPLSLGVSGLVSVASGRIEGGWVIRDRLGVLRAMGVE